MISLKIGTRSSELALAQTNIVIHKLQLFYKNSINIEIVPLITAGDEIQNKPLYEVGGKAIFSRTLHQALENRSIDCAVHSLKDLEAVEPDGIKLACVLEREDPRDVLVSKSPITNLSGIPQNWVLGTSSPRRESQIKYYQPQIETKLLRGNVSTRIRKLTEDPNMDGTVLAAAGLIRLGLLNHDQSSINGLSIRLSHIDEMVPSVGQGVIAVDCRADDRETFLLLQSIHCSQTFSNITFERYFIRCINASCRTAVGVHVVAYGSNFMMHYDYYHEKKQKLIKKKIVIHSLDDIEREIDEMGLGLMD